VGRLPEEAESNVADWHALPAIEPSDWGHPFGGRPWRVDQHGVYLRDQSGGERRFRTDGNPVTCGAVVEVFGPQILKCSAKHGVPPELLIMTIATEVGSYRKYGFTGPRTFRWEPHIGDYSAGPMQILGGTAREINQQMGLGYPEAFFPKFAARPDPPPEDLALYRADVALDVGAAYIRNHMNRTGTNPILVAAAYNAGSLRDDPENPWGLKCYGNYFDQAAAWFGDACELLSANKRRGDG
jgi:peptidoglycan L-alanyl-D-glutamate endopeptidase CwlK